MNYVLTVYIYSLGKIWEIPLSVNDMDDGVTFEDHMDFVFEYMLETDELVNIIWH